MGYKPLDYEQCEAIFSGYKSHMLDIEEAAKMLHMSVSHLRELIRKKLIPANKFGKRYTFLKINLIDYFMTEFNKKIKEVELYANRRNRIK